jgi:hypothetical protein
MNYSNEIIRRSLNALRSQARPAVRSRPAPSPAMAAARAEGRAAAAAQTAEIVRLCNAAGRPDLVPEFVIARATPRSRPHSRADCRYRPPLVIPAAPLPAICARCRPRGLMPIGRPPLSAREAGCD